MSAKHDDDATEASAAAPESEGLPASLDATEEARLMARYGRNFQAGETLFREGDPAKEAYLIQVGRVRVVKHVGTTERGLALLGPGALFGETALIDDEAHGATAIGQTDGRAITFDRDRFFSILSHHPELAAAVVRQLITRLRDAEDQVELMMLGDSELRAVSLITKLARRSGGSRTIALSPLEMASRAALDVDVVRGVVQRLCDRDYLRLVGGQIVVSDLDALGRLRRLLLTKQDLGAKPRR